MSTRIHQSGYQSQSRLSPAAITGVLLVHAGLGAVILTMSAVKAIDLTEPVIWAWNIPKDQPRPTPKPRPQKPDAREAHVTSVHREISLPDVPDITLTPAPIPDTIGGMGGGMVIDPVVPPEPSQPVLVQPRADTRFASGFQPPYPAAMLRQQMEGTVTVRVTIGPDGRVLDVALISAADPAFFETTKRQALSRWRFLPGTRDGIAITTEKVMTVHFHLTD